jgi:hypothetical protein
MDLPLLRWDPLSGLPCHNHVLFACDKSTARLTLPIISSLIAPGTDHIDALNAVAEQYYNIPLDPSNPQTWRFEEGDHMHRGIVNVSNNLTVHWVVQCVPVMRHVSSRDRDTRNQFLDGIDKTTAGLAWLPLERHMLTLGSLEYTNIGPANELLAKAYELFVLNVLPSLNLFHRVHS